MSQSSSIVIKMIFFMFWLIFCDKKRIRGIFITMNGSSLFLTSKPIFQNSYLQFTQQAFGNGRLVFQNSLNPGASPGQVFALDPLWTLQPPWSPVSFSGFQVWATFTPAPMLGSFFYRRVKCLEYMRFITVINYWVNFYVRINTIYCFGTF